MKSLYRILAMMALSLRIMASSTPATLTITNGISPRAFSGSCSTSIFTSTSTFLIYQPIVYSNPPGVGGPAYSTDTTASDVYLTRTGTATQSVLYCIETTTQEVPTTIQVPITVQVPTTVTASNPSQNPPAVQQPTTILTTIRDSTTVLQPTTVYSISTVDQSTIRDVSTVTQTIPGETQVSTLSQPGTTIVSSQGPLTITESYTTTASGTVITSYIVTTISSNRVETTSISSSQETVTSITAVPTTVSTVSTASGSTVTLPGATEVQTQTIVIPPTTVTQSVPGQTDVQTTVIPASTFVLTQEISSPPETVTLPGGTVTASGETVTASGGTQTVTASREQQTTTASGPPQTVTASEVRTITASGETSTETMVQSLSTCAVTLAPSATILTTFDPDSELTWGCSSGTNCDPPKPDLCEVWVDSPVDEFVCPAENCQPVKILALGGSNGAGKFPLSEGYFDLDPFKFGLDFSIFIKTASIVDTRSLPQQPPNNTNDPNILPRELARRIDTGVIPAACFDTCNNAYLEAQSTGKGPGLCRPDSAFMVYYLGCDLCVDKNIEQTTGISSFITSSSYLSSKFSQFLRYCKITGDVNVGLAPVGDQPAGASASTSLEEGTTTSTAKAVVGTSTLVTSTMGSPTVDNPTVGTPPPETSSTRATSTRQATANDSVGSLSSVAGLSITESSTAASSTANLSTTEATVATDQTSEIAASSAVSSEKGEASSSADRTTRVSSAAPVSAMPTSTPTPGRSNSSSSSETSSSATTTPSQGSDSGVTRTSHGMSTSTGSSVSGTTSSRLTAPVVVGSAPTHRMDKFVIGVGLIHALLFVLSLI